MLTIEYVTVGAVMAIYGDDAEPLRESIDLMEDMVRDFVDELVMKTFKWNNMDL